MLKCFEKTQNTFEFSIIPRTEIEEMADIFSEGWRGTCSYYKANIMADTDYNNKASAAMVLTWLSQKIPTIAQNGLRILDNV